MAASVEHYLPTLERARERGLVLPREEPRVEKVAALTVYARVTKRTRSGVSAVDDLCEVFVPGDLRHADGMFRLEAKLELALSPRLRVPAPCLRCPDLRPRYVGSAYRDGGEKEPDFYGHRFGDVIDDAFESVERFMLGGHVLSFDIAAYAQPLLWLRYPFEPDRVLMVGGLNNELYVVFVSEDDA